MLTMKNISGLPWPTTNPRARSEWDFSRKALPNSEVAICHEYELGRIRQSGSWRDAISGFRSNA
jgi:hypothetical protein